MVAQSTHLRGLWWLWRANYQKSKNIKNQYFIQTQRDLIFLKKFTLNFKNPPHPPHPPPSILPATTVPPHNGYNPPHSLSKPQKCRKSEMRQNLSACESPDSETGSPGSETNLSLKNTQRQICERSLLISLKKGRLTHF